MSQLSPQSPRHVGDNVRRHWQLVMCAFTFCWWTCAESLEEKALPGATFKEAMDYFPATSKTAERGKKEDSKGAFASPPTTAVLDGGVVEGEELVGALRDAVALLESVLGSAPATGVKSVT
jgi:hypothetical protein